MANEVRTKFDAKASFTKTLASLAAAAARQVTLVANSSARPGAIVYVKIESGGTAPTAGGTYNIYLIRGDDASSSTYRTDGAGASDAAITIENAPLLGAIVVTNTANKVFYGEFDTAIVGPLGPEWGVAILNNTSQALHGTEANHLVEYAYYVPELQ